MVSPSLTRATVAPELWEGFPAQASGKPNRSPLEATSGIQPTRSRVPVMTNCSTDAVACPASFPIASASGS